MKIKTEEVSIKVETERELGIPEGGSFTDNELEGSSDDAPIPDERRIWHLKIQFITIRSKHL